MIASNHFIKQNRGAFVSHHNTANERIPIHEWTRISFCLAIVGGFLDAYTYIFRGGVFANAQTGNMVLMGISIEQHNFLRAFYYLIPIAAFFLGVLITEIFKRKFTGARFTEWQHLSLAIEIVLLILVAFLPKQVPDAFANVTVSFVCSMQVNSFRKVKGTPYASTMCTGNLRSGTEFLCTAVIDKNKDAAVKSLRYFLVIFAFCCGAVAGAFLTGRLAEKSVLICSFILLAILVVLIWDKHKNTKSITRVDVK